MEKCLVTGATGFLGHHLVKQLRESKRDVVALVRAPDPMLEALGVTQKIGDVLDEASVRAAATGANVVFHCAGRVSRKPELRRQDVSDVAWSGARVIAGVPLGMRFRASTELELAAPDHPRGRGSVWPWGLVALAFRHPSGWEAASAVEAASTPEHAFMMNALVRVSRALEVR